MWKEVVVVSLGAMGKAQQTLVTVVGINASNQTHGKYQECSV
jgi:hypothetical protein